MERGARKHRHSSVSALVIMDCSEPFLSGSVKFFAASHHFFALLSTMLTASL